MTAASEGLKSLNPILSNTNLASMYASAPNRPEAQDYKRALEQQQFFLKVLRDVQGPSSRSMPASTIANLQVPLGADPAVQKLLAKSTKNNKQQ